MALGIFKPAVGTPGAIASSGVPGRKRPGHIVALSEDGRIDGMGPVVRLAEALEKRTPVPIANAQQSSVDGSRPLAPAPSVKTIDPYDITIVMAAADGEPVVSQLERDTWGKFRVAYDVVLDASPFRISGSLLLLPSADPTALTERGTELFVAVLNATVQLGMTPIRDVPKDVILVNRSHLRRVVSATMRR